MIAGLNPPTGVCTPDWLRRERILQTFEAAWQSGGRPTLDDFLPADGPDRLALLVELVQTELEFRRKAGETPSLDEYHRRYPDLAAHLDDAPPAPPRRLGKYELLEVVGQGSFGVVYRARDADLAREVAVKLPRPGLFATAAEQDNFLREARSAAALRHPHLVAVHDAGRTAGTCFVVSDFVAGATLAEHLQAGRPDPRTAAERTAVLADALHHAHQHGVIHRDVKPSNILLDRTGKPYLTDFGLAKRQAADSSLAASGCLLGTPLYMSPEQARGEAHQVDARSDVFSLGVILYEMLTGMVPFRGSGPSLLAQIVEDEPVPPHKLADHVPRDLETVCLKAIRKDPSGRYQSAEELAADLRRFLHGDAVRARPLGPTARLARWARRKPTLAAMAATLVGVTLLGGASVFWMWRRAEANFHHAEDQRRAAQESQRHAEDRFRQADTILYDLYAHLADGTGGDLKEIQRRRPMLEKVVKHYESLFHQRPDDRSIQDRLAEAYAGLGNFLGSEGRAAEAADAHRRAVATMARVAQDNPAAPWPRFALAVYCTHLSQAEWQLGRADAARAAWDQGFSALESLRREDHLDVPFRRGVIGAALAFSRSADQFGRRDDSRRAVALAHLFVEWPAREKTDDASLCQQVADGWYQLGLHLHEQSRHQEAIDPFSKAADLLETVTNDQPTDGDLQHRRAQCLQFVGFQYRELNRPAEAVPWYRRALAVYQGPLREPATVGKVVFDHIAAWHHLALALRRDGRRDEAMQAVNEARHLLEASLRRHTEQLTTRPDDADSRYAVREHSITLGRILREQGQVAEAVASFRRARPFAAGNPRDLYRVASDLALCYAAVTKQDRPVSPEEQSWADLTMAVLREAVRAGYRDAAELGSDRDFDTLRVREDFRRLETELGAKASRNEER